MQLSPVVVLVAVGAVLSLFLGVFSLSIHIHIMHEGKQTHPTEDTAARIRRCLTNEPAGKRYTWPHILYQMWFNFAGSAVGWIAVVLLYRDSAARWTEPSGMISTLTWAHFVVALVAVVGVVGWLPRTVAGLVGSIAAVEKAISEWLTSKLKG